MGQSAVVRVSNMPLHIRMSAAYLLLSRRSGHEGPSDEKIVIA